MRKSVAIEALVLIATVLLSPAVAAGRPPKGEAKTVAFSGENMQGVGEPTVESTGKGVTVYGPIEEYEHIEPDSWTMMCGEILRGLWRTQAHAEELGCHRGL